MEALETSISYWEDALAAYQSGGGGGSGGGNTAVLLGLEDSTFCRELQELLDAAYQLQEQSEMLFLDQRSALFGGDKVSYTNYFLLYYSILSCKKLLIRYLIYITYSSEICELITGANT